MVLGKIKEKYYLLGITRYVRIQNYLSYLSEKINVSDEKDKRNVARIENLVEERLRAVKRLQLIILFSYVGIYFSFISYIFSDSLILSSVALFISKIVSFFGTTLFFITLFLSTRFSNLHYQDLNLLSAHLISIYNKYNTIDDEELFATLNQYQGILDFLKVRNVIKKD